MRSIIFAAAIVFSSAAWATDFSAPVGDGMGGTLKDGKEEATLGKVAARALFAPTQEKISGEEKFRRGILGTKLFNGGDIELSAEDIALVKKAIGEAFGPQIVAETWPMLDPSIKVNPVKTEIVPAPEEPKQ